MEGLDLGPGGGEGGRLGGDKTAFSKPWISLQQSFDQEGGGGGGREELEPGKDLGPGGRGILSQIQVIGSAQEQETTKMNLYIRGAMYL